MGFLGIGTWEILLILILALVILGPGRLTEVARILGKTLRTIRKVSADLTTAVTRELEVTQSKPPPSPPKEEKTGEAPSAISRAKTESRDDQPTNPGGTSATK